MKRIYYKKKNYIKQTRTHAKQTRCIASWLVFTSKCRWWSPKIKWKSGMYAARNDILYSDGWWWWGWSMVCLRLNVYRLAAYIYRGGKAQEHLIPPPKKLSWSWRIISQSVNNELKCRVEGNNVIYKLRICAQSRLSRFSRKSFNLALSSIIFFFLFFASCIIYYDKYT